jgi:hypothetical protein
MITDSLSIADEVTNGDGTPGQTSQNAEREIGLVLRLNNAHGDMPSVRLGSRTIDSTGRTGSGAFASC